MSKVSELLHDESSGGSGPSETPHHLTLRGILGDIGAELKHQGEMGATELAKAVLGSQDGFVLYGRGGREQESQQGHGLPQQQGSVHEMDGPSR